jgi:lipoprotein NlpD
MLALCACSPPPKVVVEERSVLTARQESEKLGGQLIRFAQPGDTLHGIAFAAGLDVNRVAAWNGIRDTSKLQVGQRIRLTAPIGFTYRAPAPVASKTRKSPVTSNRNKPRVADNGHSSPQTATPTPSAKGGVSNSGTSSRSFERWWWPTRGAVITRFELASGRQGIDIRTDTGQAVTAAGDGEVVYVGNSLKGYGNLIIIKHSEQYLSAYAHNRDIYVNEGDQIRAKHKIGSVGLNNRRQSALHFQIRKNGKPVNPLDYLPKI